MLYSEGYPAFQGSISSEVSSFIDDVIRHYNLTDISVLQFSDVQIALPVKIPVSLPSRGAVNIDIRKVEPVIIVVPVYGYPFIAPQVFSDRNDFPKHLLSHLFVTKEKDVPTPLCLVRNNRNEWFSSCLVSDFFNVVEEWFWKAASGFLSTDGEEFDPTRLESYVGYYVYKYDKLYNIIDCNNGVTNSSSFAILMSSISMQEETFMTKIYENIPLIRIPKLLEIIPKIDENNLTHKVAFALLVWNNSDDVYSEYDITMPNNYNELLEFGKKYGMDLKSPVNFYLANSLQKVNGIPIILAVKRPKKMIGYNGDIEFFNFIISGENVVNCKIPMKANVSTNNHLEPFSPELAEIISGKNSNEKIAFFGAGSLGAKIIMHQVRNGNKHFKVFDNDKLLKHNLTRHSLLSNRVGQNKAMAIVQEAQSFFEVDQINEIQGFDKDLILTNKDEIEECNMIVDSTASLNVQNWLVKNSSILGKTVIRVEIAHRGALGLLYREGGDRNPRVDDLVNYAYYLSTTDDALRSWRQYDAEFDPETLSIGLGCSSTTSVMADDDISFHAAQFSKFIQNSSEIGKGSDKGIIFLTKTSLDYPYNTENTVYEVPQFTILPCKNTSDWEFRMLGGLQERMLDISNKSGELETGGVLIGMVSYKTRTIHVLDIIDAPPDSEYEPCSFYRGVENLPEEVDRIKFDTGNMVGYVGEWHSHPMGLNNLSGQDLKNVKELMKLNNSVPIPTCSVIVSNNIVIPFIFE